MIVNHIFHSSVFFDFPSKYMHQLKCYQDSRGTCFDDGTFLCQEFSS